MSKRLASFHGPSTPTASPVQLKQPTTPTSPSRNTESTYHRKVRSALQELRSTTRTWDDLVLIDGLKAATSLIDTRTELDNALRSLPSGKQPQTRIAGPRLAIMEKRINELDTVILKLRKQFAKMNSLIEGLEDALYEAHRIKGWAWIHIEPLWCTWPLERFVSKLPELLPPYHRSLHMHIDQVDMLRSHSLSFDASREIITTWAAQPHLEEGRWDAEWEDLCAVEVERWNTR